MSGSTRIADLLMRGAFGTVFIAAGSLKLADSGWMALFAFCEIVLGSCLFCGLFKPFCRGACLLLFLTFVANAGWGAIGGSEACGCFGEVRVSPGLMLVLDVVAVLAFATWRIMPNGQLMSRGIAAIVLISSATLVAPVWGAPPGVIKYSNGSVVLHPSGWLGYSFPLGSDLELAERLGAGKWQLLFVSAGCPKCEQSLKDSAKNDAVDYETILVAVPHGPNAEHEYRWSGEIAHLSPKLNWIVRTPMSVIVEEGIVSRVSFH